MGEWAPAMSASSVSAAADTGPRVVASRPLLHLVDGAPAGRFPIDDLSWYRRFAATPSSGFLLDNAMVSLPFEAQLDLLSVCRNALPAGGRIRFSAPDPNHPSPAYQAKLRAADRSRLLDLEGWCQALTLLGFEAVAVEGYRRSGEFVARDPSFDRHGRIARSSRIDPRAADERLRMSTIIIDAVRPALTGDSLPVWPEPIFALGDSHVRFLAGRDNTAGLVNDRIGNWYQGYCARIIGVHVGPSLAFNANREGTKTRGRERMLLALSGQDPRIPTASRVLFSLGEIDCRGHVTARAQSAGLSIDEVVDRVCHNYIDLLDDVAARGFRPGCWGPIAPTWISANKDPEHPVVGSYEQRLAATRRFNATMGRLCTERGFPYLSATERLLDATGWPERSFYCDPIHLSQKARPILTSLLDPVLTPSRELAPFAG